MTKTANDSRLFSKILIANRGEVAVRIIRTCRQMGIGSVVVYSEADAGSLAVEMADEAVAIGPSPAAQSYLVAEKIIAACKATCADAGIVFIGPNPHAIDAMGDKIASKRAAAEAGVSCVPGHIGEIDGPAHAAKIAGEIGYPVMLKASAGGGGKGIRVVRSGAEIGEALSAVKAEA